METQYHDCGDLPDRVDIKCGEVGRWIWRFRQLSTGITHCPYCGEKLEPPPVPIEVRRDVLEDLRDKAAALFDLWPSSSEKTANDMLLTLNALLHD